MKFLLSTAVAVMMMTTVASAQHSSAHSAIGIKGGANFYNLNSDPDNTSLKTSIGFHVGALGHVHLGTKWALQPELTYSSQGAKFEMPGDDIKLKLGYINVPILVQYMFDNGFRIQAGPQVGFLINAKTKLGGTDTDVKDDFTEVDIAASAGLSYVDPKSGVGIDARYNLGLNNIAEGGGPSLKNRGAQVGLFFLFPKAKK
jgi:hypothetical protein